MTKKNSQQPKQDAPTINTSNKSDNNQQDNENHLEKVTESIVLAFFVVLAIKILKFIYDYWFSMGSNEEL
jgi:hypothetical protein